MGYAGVVTFNGTLGIPHSTSDIGYVRLHGRNYKQWFSAKADVRQRYDHLYSLDELETWAGRIKAVDAHTQNTYAVTNNHNLGKAAVNAFDLAALLFGKPVKPPSQLVRAYPELQNLT